jgi:hypothetical protein
VLVELFPAAPPAGRDFQFSSPLAETAKLYVTPSAAAASEELGPRESYFRLFHFDASLADAAAAEPGEAEAFGAVELTKSGLRLGENGGFRYSRLLLPVTDGQLAPCTITLRLEPEDGAAGQELLATESANRSFRLKLALDGEGRPWAEVLLPAGAAVRLPSGIPALAGPHRLDLSLLPADRSLTATWFLDGLQSSALTVKTEAYAIQPEGTTLVGGEKGFRGRITELGVYHRDEGNRPSVDPGIYRWVMERRLGRRLILAEGFEGFRLPESFRAAPETAARLSAGSLQLEPGAGLTLPYFDLNAGIASQTVLELVFAAPLPAGATASLTWESDGKAFLDILPEGKALASDRELAAFAPLTDRLLLELGERSLTLQAASGPVQLALPDPVAGQERWLSVGIRSPAGETGVAIDRALAYLKSTE